MTTEIAPSDYKTIDTGESPDPSHSKWKRDKIAQGLEQAKDRASLIPAEQVWRNLGLER